MTFANPLVLGVQKNAEKSLGGVVAYVWVQGEWKGESMTEDTLKIRSEFGTTTDTCGFLSVQIHKTLFRMLELFT